MRIDSDKPIAVVRALLEDTVGEVLLGADDVARMLDRSIKTFRPTCYRAGQPFDPAAATTRVLLHSDDTTFEIVALVSQGNRGMGLTLITGSGEILVAFQSDAGRRADGIVQIRGMAPGVCLVTREKMFLAVEGAKLVTTPPLRSYSVEKLEKGGWVRAGIPIRSIPDAWVEVTLDDPKR